jgi:LmbE family N-acetylglucosaminyl deacetylase
MQQPKRLLISFAHPDDESFGLGGMIAKYVDEGVDVYYLCATNGDVGTVSEELLNGYESISELRLAELDCASEVLGFKDVYKLGYKDSGMMHNDDNQQPGSLWHTWGRNPEKVIREVTEVIREVKPHVIITFNRYGGYGHPDHIAIQQATTDAFYRAGDTDYLTDGQPSYQPQKLYYNSIPTFFVRLGVWMSRLRGQNPRKLGRNNDIDLVAILDHVEKPHVFIDIGDYIDIWDEASACHVSQGGGQGGFLPRWLRKILSKKQGLSRVHPAPLTSQIDENDIFDGMRLEEVETVP